VSHEATIDIALAGPVPYLVVLEVLQGGGWEVRDVRGTSYLGENDLDGSDWTIFSDTSIAEVVSIVQRKDELTRTAGLVLLFRGTQVGGSFLWHDRKSVSVSLSINRITTDDGWTDANWYLGRLRGAFLASSIALESVTFREIA
jgi:hypothetical protein